ncbi:MAG: hypothetical protein ACJ74Q_15760 [Pyrinomonadaceae bacterium]
MGKKRGLETRDLMRRLKKPSPGAVVAFVAALVICTGAAASFVGSGEAARYPQVVYVDSEGNPTGASKESGVVVPDVPVFSGEVYYTSLRIGEASAVAGGAILYSATQGAAAAARNGGDALPGLPADHRELLAGMRAAGAMPESMTVQDDLRLVSATSIITVRYRRDPLGVEVVSLSRKKEYGPAILLRLPDESPADTRQGIRYFHSLKLEGAELPDAFAPAAEVIRKGWSPEAWAGEVVNQEEYRNARQWLSAQTAEMTRPAAGGR